MEKRKYYKPEALLVKVDCEIVLQPVSQQPTAMDCQGPDCPDPIAPYPQLFNPLKWFK